MNLKVAMLLAAVFALVSTTALAKDSKVQTYVRHDTIEPGQAITYYFGPRARSLSTTLTRKLIFQDHGKDGVGLSILYRFASGGGKYTSMGAYCDQGKQDYPEVWDLHGVLAGSASVIIHCAVDPETVTLTNNTKAKITVLRVNSDIDGTPPPPALAASGGATTRVPDTRVNVPTRMPEAGGGGMGAGKPLPWRVLVGMLVMMAASWLLLLTVYLVEGSLNFVPDWLFLLYLVLLLVGSAVTGAYQNQQDPFGP